MSERRLRSVSGARIITGMVMPIDRGAGAASGSYLAVPATVRLAIPEADAHLHFTMPLALTFPFNVVVGIPPYAELIRLTWSVD